MQRAREIIRSAVEGWRREEAAERVQRWRGDPDISSSAEEVSRRHAWLRESSALEALGEAMDRGSLEVGEWAATLGHLARAHEEAEFADIRARLRAFHGRIRTLGERSVPVGALMAELWASGGLARRGEVARAAGELAELVDGPILEARARADEATAVVRGLVVDSPDEGDEVALGELAIALLKTTEARGHEATHWLLERHSMPPTWSGLMAALRAPDLDGLFPRKNRWRRAAAHFGELGFERELSNRLRVEPSHGAMDPRARLALIALPLDVRIGPSPLELGPVSELAAADALGRGLALCLASPGLPPALRRPLAGSVSRAFGGLSAQVLFDPLFIGRAGRVEPAHRELYRRHLGASALTLVRLSAATLLAGGARDAEKAAEVFSGVLDIEIPPAVATLMARTPGGASARLRGALGGLALWDALREELDEDWYRNPRSAEILRAGASRGGGLSIETFLGELGGEMSAGVARAAELPGG